MTGLPESEKDAIRTILKNPESSVRLIQIAAAVTQSNNLNEGDILRNQRITDTGTELAPEVFDSILDRVSMSGTVMPTELSLINTQEKRVVNLTERRSFRVYDSAESMQASAGATVAKPYDSFVTINEKLVPLKG